LYEIGLQEDPQFPSVFSYTPSYRLVLLRACLKATKAFLTNRFARKIGDFPRYICVSSFDFVYSFLTALKLITVQLPGWDLNQVRQDLEFEKFVEQSAADMDHAAERRRNRRHLIFRNWAVGASAAHEGLDGLMAGADDCKDEDPFLKVARKIRMLSKVMVSRLFFLVRERIFLFVC